MTFTHPSIPLARTGGVIGMAVAGLLVAGACSSSGSGGGAPSNDLGRALALVHAQGTKTTLEFGRPTAALAANGGKPGSGPYSRVIGYGLDSLAAYSILLPKVLGFDPLSAEYAVTAGQPPKSGTLLSGLDTGSVKAKATALGASVDGSTYRFQPDYHVAVDSKLGTALTNGGIGFNVISVDDKNLRIASASAGVDLTSGGGDTLDSDDAFTAVAGCLDDPLAAELVSMLPTARVPAPAGADSPTRTVGIAAVGVGVTGKKGSTPVEHLCVSADSTDHASTIAGSIRSALKDGSSPEANEKWSQLLQDAKVTVSGTTVSLTAAAQDGIGGRLLTSFQQGDLPGLAG